MFRKPFFQPDTVINLRKLALMYVLLIENKLMENK